MPRKKEYNGLSERLQSLKDPQGHSDILALVKLLTQEESACRKLTSELRSHKAIIASAPMTTREIRETVCEASQYGLGITQRKVSLFDQHGYENSKLSTLAKYMEGLGGVLKTIVVLPNEGEFLLQNLRVSFNPLTPLETAAAATASLIEQPEKGFSLNEGDLVEQKKRHNALKGLKQPQHDRILAVVDDLITVKNNVFHLSAELQRYSREDINCDIQDTRPFVTLRSLREMFNLEKLSDTVKKLQMPEATILTVDRRGANPKIQTLRQFVEGINKGVKLKLVFKAPHRPEITLKNPVKQQSKLTL